MRGADQHKTWNELTGSPFQLLTERLVSLSQAGVWTILLTGMIVITVADYLTPTRMQFGPLYIAPICFAFCRLTPRFAMYLAVLAAALTVGTNFIIHPNVPSPGMVASELFLYAAAFATLINVLCFVHYRFERKWAFTRCDKLTGALIRSAFRQEAAAIMAAAAIQGRPLLLTYVDLDGFKSVNDHYGHEAGDRVLQDFGIAGRATLRSGDCFGRMGGDEFAVLIPLASSEAARDLAEALHDRFTAALAATGYNVTCSMGALIILPDGNPSLEDVMRRVDRLMYAVKRGGKNSFRLATTVSSPEQELPLFASLMSVGK